ncbi:MAG: hypothetical protein ACE144_04535 [Thermodesulfobacteriota bacterium]
MKKKVLLLTSILIIYSFSSGWAQTPLDFPEKALRLIAESAKDSCTICARQTLEKAFRLFDEQFPPERIFTTTGSCRFVRTALSEENELALSCDFPGKESLPLLTLRFHTPSNHLVGISAADFTEESIASDYLSAPPGTVFEGMIKTIVFLYGDGATYSYSASRGVIQVHCRLLTVKKKSP